jgi:hypothetical protein
MPFEGAAAHPSLSDITRLRKRGSGNLDLPNSLATGGTLSANSSKPMHYRRTTGGKRIEARREDVTNLQT